MLNKKQTSFLLLIRWGALLLLILYCSSCKQNTTTVDLFVNNSVIHDHRLAIPLEINGNTYFFLWDTGSSISFIHNSLASTLELNTNKELYLNRMYTMREIRLDTFQVENINFKLGDFRLNTDFFLDDKGYMAPKEADPTIKGVIGQDIISRFHWLFNLKTSQVIVSKKSIPFESEATTLNLPFVLDSLGAPIINLKLDSMDCKAFEFDTGARRSFHPTDRFPVCPSLILSEGLNGFSPLENYFAIAAEEEKNKLERVILCDSICINDFQLKNISVTEEKKLRENQNYITVNLVFQFDEMYYNPEDKEIKLIKYNNNPDYDVPTFRQFMIDSLEILQKTKNEQKTLIQ